ncbi:MULTISPECIES: FkbM family methyltransferase [Ruegeria]|uniref:FkbM family methyltransferase n=1 Tax=Ruegeria TaxID=97050 RepID=UPI001480D58F|nr:MULTISPECIES: FkbM family methyltransferase [Ruegeria]MBO9409890.1 FkbM family methyltransferase [Ruegeria sp. R8_1]MBO9414891.1 FkbM family methyltransferase [Ruegeria sp. R8_2]
MDDTEIRLTRRLKRRGYQVSPDKETGSYIAGLGFDVATVFDVGVAGGTAHLYEAFPTTKFVLIEPISEYEDKLRRNWSDKIDFDFHACGVGSQAGQTTLRIPTVGHRSMGTRATMMTFDEAARAHTKAIEERQVPVRTLDDIAVDYQGPYGLKIDTEGFEVEVIKGASEMLKNCAFVLAEVSVRRRYEGGYKFSDFVAVMAAHGFELHDFIRPPSPEATDCDAIFAPFEGPRFDYRDAKLSRIVQKSK